MNAWEVLSNSDENVPYSDVPIHEVISLISGSPRVALELGCNRGATGAELKRRFPKLRYIGVETCQSAAALAETRLDQVISCDFLDWNGSLDLPGQQGVDLVIATDVLEHLFNPWATLAKIRPLLSDDAHVYATIPNARNLILIEDLARGNWRYERVGLLDVTHIRFFTRSSMIEMFESNGYEIDSISAIRDSRVPAVPVAEGLRGTLDFKSISIHDIDAGSAAELSALKYLIIAKPRTNRHHVAENAGSNTRDAGTSECHHEGLDGFGQKLQEIELLLATGAIGPAKGLAQELFHARVTDPNLLCRLGSVLSSCGCGAEAEDTYRKVLVLDPLHGQANIALGQIHLSREDFDSAEACMRTAMACPSTSREAAAHLISMFAGLRRWKPMCELARHSASNDALSSTDLLRIAAILVSNEFWFDAAQCLVDGMTRLPSAFPQSSQELARCCVILTHAGSFDGVRMLGDLFDIADRVPDELLRNLLLRLLPHAWSLEDNRRLAQVYARHGAAIEQRALGRKLAPWRILEDDSASTTIGFLGSLAINNSAAKFLLPVLAHLAAGHYRCLYYATGALIAGDPVQAELGQIVTLVRQVNGLGPQEIASLVASDGCSILVDLDGFSRVSKTEVFAYRAAPVQINWLNWPSTLGMQSADYLMAPKEMLPDDPSLIFERPLVMETPYGCYTPIVNSPIVPEPPCKRNGFVTFAVTCAPYKLNPRLVRLWADVLSRVPDSRLRVIRHDCADDAFCSMLTREFARCGIEGDRLEALDFKELGISHLDAYSTADVCLDSAGFGGATTAADSLWMGVPLVALRGPGMHQRLSPAILDAVGIPELIADSTDAYIEIAAGLAADHDRILHYRRSLREQFEQSRLRRPDLIAAEVQRCFNRALEETRQRIRSLEAN